MAINAIEQTTWIPCSERLPEKAGYYICAVYGGISILEFMVGNDRYHEGPSFVSDVLGRCNPIVTHWMPLPHKPQAESEVQK